MLLPKWLPIVAEHLKQLKGTTSNEKNNKNVISDNPIFSYCTLWLFDSGDLSRGIEYALLAIKHGQPTPSNIKRQWPSLIADTVYDWAETEAEHGRSTEPYFSQVFEQVANNWKLPEQVTAKYYKFAGLALLRIKNGDVTPSHIGSIKQLRQADLFLAKAAELHKHAQVKTVRSRVAMRIRALEELNAQ